MSAYDGRNASVDVVIRASNQALLAQMIDLTWVEGDWKVALADDGQMRTPMGAVQSLMRLHGVGRCAVSCGTFELTCHVSEAAAGFLESTLGQMAREAAEAAGRAVAGLGTLWVAVPTPDLVTGDGSVKVKPGSRAARRGDRHRARLGAVPRYTIAALSLIAIFAMAMVNHRRGEALFATKRLAIVLFSTVLLGAATRGAGAGQQRPSSNFQHGDVPATNDVVVLDRCDGAGHHRRRHPHDRDPPPRAGPRPGAGPHHDDRDFGRGVTGMNLLIRALDSLANKLINGSLACGPAADSSCFGGSVSTLLVFTSAVSATGLPAFLLLLLSVVAIFASAVQIVLMVVRSALMVVFAGLLPTAAAGSSTRTGRDWLNKLLSWMFGWMLYKPIAAFIYAAAFMLTATPFYADDGTGWCPPSAASRSCSWRSSRYRPVQGDRPSRRSCDER
ncbi:hypothetical protein [Cellulomonas denverensis]|uniref:hypothetical protein n=1 Tax=Cellulomonas denverensis TaxID=264297 RepID=UPI0035EA9ED9